MCPMTSVKTYHALAVRRLPALTQLDGTAISARDRHHANTRGASIAPAVLRAACKFRPVALAPAAPPAATRPAAAPASSRSGPHCEVAKQEPPLCEAIEVVLPVRCECERLCPAGHSCLQGA
jgi:hypothetical protein